MSSVKKELIKHLEAHKVLNLAYIDQTETPQSCALWYASAPDLTIYYLSSLSTRHGKNLKEGGQVSFTINEDRQYWKEITGIQGRGQVKLMENPERAWKIYTTKFNFVLEQFPVLEQALKETKIWELTPSWLRLIDNSKGFGHNEEIHL